ncbi:hypothetical protein DPMN_106076 [Dreissena polymorpha]|uniref:Uncharacterized protein n=1 Tax=Dreissena polymorpha TaxID=45954 RepID=A0A9D4K4F7_DREPO|nr:hypothetical protein DPMN_106076 [Dreissena polymorpha]
MNSNKLRDISRFKYLAVTLSKNGTSTAAVQIRPQRWPNCTSRQVVPSASPPSTSIILNETGVWFK